MAGKPEGGAAATKMHGRKNARPSWQKIGDSLLLASQRRRIYLARLSPAKSKLSQIFPRRLVTKMEQVSATPRHSGAP